MKRYYWALFGFICTIGVLLGYYQSYQTSTGTPILTVSSHTSASIHPAIQSHLSKDIKDMQDTYDSQYTKKLQSVSTAILEAAESNAGILIPHKSIQQLTLVHSHTLQAVEIKKTEDKESLLEILESYTLLSEPNKDTDWGMVLHTGDTVHYYYFSDSKSYPINISAIVERGIPVIGILQLLPVEHIAQLEWKETLPAPTEGRITDTEKITYLLQNLQTIPILDYKATEDTQDTLDIEDVPLLASHNLEYQLQIQLQEPYQPNDYILVQVSANTLTIRSTLQPNRVYYYKVLPEYTAQLLQLLIEINTM